LFFNIVIYFTNRFLNRFFLAAKSTACKYKINDQLCNGQAKLRRIIKKEGEEYIIGCDKWVRGDKWHRYIKVPEEIDLELLRNLFQGRHVCISYNLHIYDLTDILTK